MYQQLGWLVNLEKSELEPKQDFDFVGYQFDLRSGRVRLTPDRWQNLQEKILKLPSLLAWKVSESLKKVIPIPRSLHPHLQWWLKEDNVLTGQPLHPIKHALQIFTDASIEGWGAHLDEHTARGTWSLLELKAVFLALKEFQNLCSNKIVLVATDNTTVVSYINKEGGKRSGPLCALLWGILTWFTRKQVTLKPDTFQAG